MVKLKRGLKWRDGDLGSRRWHGEREGRTEGEDFGCERMVKGGFWKMHVGGVLGNMGGTMRGKGTAKARGD